MRCQRMPTAAHLSARSAHGRTADAARPNASKNTKKGTVINAAARSGRVRLVGLPLRIQLLVLNVCLAPIKSSVKVAMTSQQAGKACQVGAPSMTCMNP